MKLNPRRAATLARTLLVAALLPLASPATQAQGHDPRVDGQVLVRLRSTTALAPLLARYQLAVQDQFGARPLYQLELLGPQSIDEMVAALALEPDVLVAEPNYMQRSPEARKNVVWAIGTAAQYASQWAPGAMRLPDAHGIATGAGVRVAVLDTGVDASHPVLAGKLLPGRDFVGGDNDPAEEGSTADLGYGHGTHVAGLVALAAPDAMILPLRVLDPAGQGNVWVLAEALLYAIDPDRNPATNDGAQIVNMSLGTLDRTRIVDTVLKLAACSLADPEEPPEDFTDPGYNGDKRRCQRFVGTVIVAAAGNGGNESEKQYPAAEGEYGLLAMGASRKNHRLAPFTNSGSWVDVVAPGDRITSSVPGGGYGSWSGTSMAAPLAAGAAALLRERFPKMKPDDLVKRLERNGQELCDTNAQLQVDAYAALKGREPPDTNCRN